VAARNNIIRSLCCSTWGAATATVRTATLTRRPSTVHHALSERSSHCKKLDTTLNDAMRVITGCLRSTPVSNIQVLPGIAPPAIRRREKTGQRIAKAKEDGSHLLHETVTKNRRNQHLKSRKPLHQQKAGNIEGKTSGKNWMKEEWQSRWQESTSRVKVLSRRFSWSVTREPLQNRMGPPQPPSHWGWPLQAHSMEVEAG